MPTHTPLFFALLSSTTPAGLGLEAAVDRALERAPELVAAEAGVKGAAAVRDKATSAYAPRVKLDASYLLRWPKNDLPIEFPANLPPQLGLTQPGDVDDIHHVDVGLIVQQRIFDLTRGAGGDAAEASERAELASREDVELKLAFRARATFLGALYAREVRRIAETSLKVAEEEQRTAEMRAEVGTGTRIAVAQARVRAASLSAQAARAANEEQRLGQELESLLAVSPLPPLEGDLEKALLSLSAGPKRDRSPELERFAALADAAHAGARGKALGFVPTLSFQGAVRFVYPRALALEFGPVLEAGLVASWSIFDGFQRDAEEAELDAKAEQLTALGDAAKETRDRKLVELVHKAKSAKTDREAAERAVAENQIYLNAAQAALETGAGTELDVHQAELGLDQGRIAVKKAQLDAALVEAERLAVSGVARLGSEQ